MNLREFLKYEEICEIQNLKLTKQDLKITFDSDSIEDNSLLFIYKRVGGNYNIDLNSVNKKFYAVVFEDGYEIENCNIPSIKVKNIRSAISYSFSIEYPIDYEKTKFIGVTGTNGKTTTASLIYKVLLNTGHKVGFIGTGTVLCNEELLCDSNYSLTTPDPSNLFKYIKKMQDCGCEYIIMEVSSHSLALKKVEPIKFEIGIFTNFSHEHLDFHKNEEDYFNCKMSLFKQCKKGIFNIDVKEVKSAYINSKCNKISVGILEKGDVYATDIEDLKLQGSRFYYREKGLIFAINLNLLGLFNIYNALLAVKCLIEVGLKPCIVKSELKKITFIEGRMQLVATSPYIIIDYAHTPKAFELVLKTLKSYKNDDSKLTVVFGCGGERDIEKREIMGRFASEIADYSIITKDNCRNESFQSITSGIIKGFKNENYKVIENRKSAIEDAIKKSKSTDIIALIGKGREKYMLEKGKYIKYCEKETVLSILKERKEKNENKT